MPFSPSDVPLKYTQTAYVLYFYQTYPGSCPYLCYLGKEEKEEPTLRTEVELQKWNILICIFTDALPKELRKVKWGSLSSHCLLLLPNHNMRTNSPAAQGRNPPSLERPWYFCTVFTSVSLQMWFFPLPSDNPLSGEKRASSGAQGVGKVWWSPRQTSTQRPILT